MNLLLVAVVQAQPYPVTITIAVSPPYTARINDYIAQPNKLMATLINTSSTVQSVYVLGIVSDGAGINIFTDPRFKMSQPLILQPGIPYRLNLDNIEQVFDAGHLVFQGITKDELLYRKGLPEGDYTICLSAYDYVTNVRLSPEEPQGCSNTFPVRDVEPPVIIQPVAGDTLLVATPQIVNFIWTRPVGAPPKVEYNLKLFTVLPGTRNSNEAVKVAIMPVFFETTVTVNSFLYGPTAPSLVAGQTYAFLVTAIDPANSTNFRNHGMSEVGWFTWGGNGSSTMRITGPYSISGPMSICQGESAHFTVTGGSSNSNIDSRWLISTGSPCMTPASLPTRKLEIFNSPSFFFRVTDGLLTTDYPTYALLAAANQGWMNLAGATGFYSGSIYNTPTFLPAGVYCIGWAEQDPTWEFADPPVQLTVYAPTIAGSLTSTQSGGCAPPQVTVNLTLSGYVATAWWWEVFNFATTSWTLCLPRQPSILLLPEAPECIPKLPTQPESTGSGLLMVPVPRRSFPSMSLFFRLRPGPSVWNLILNCLLLPEYRDWIPA